LPTVDSQIRETSFQMPDADGLVDWLLGVGLGGSSRDNRQPYEHILIWLSTAYNRDELKTGLASVAARLLTDYCDGRLAERRIDDTSFLIYNLLRLCSGLSRPEELWHPLLRIYHALVADRMPSSEIGAALQAALIPNQAGPDLKDEWMNVIAGRDSVLGCGEVNGFLGVLCMSEVSGPLKKPWIAAIEEALRLLAKQYEDEQNEFQEYVDRALRFWPSYESWDFFELELTALNHGWPSWAIWCLPIHTVRSPKDPWKWLVSDYVKDSVPCGFSVTVVQPWPDAKVSLVRVDPDSVGSFFEAVGEHFDKLCLKLRGQFQEDRSRRTLMARVLQLWGGSPGKTNARMPSWDEARAQIMATIRMKQVEDTVGVIDKAAQAVDGLRLYYEEKLNDIRGATASPSSDGPQHLLAGLAAMIEPSQETRQVVD
jgi:hypothetical protein